MAMASTGRDYQVRLRRLAKSVVGPQVSAYRQRPDALRRILAEYQPGPLHLDGDRVPARWWVRADNFGDLLSPWLISKMTGREVVQADPSEPHYVAVGSVLKLASATSTVWGAGCFGSEDSAHFAPDATYTAVRGPLSRTRLRAAGIRCPKVFGDPALLTPAYYSPKVKQTHKYGIVARWSEDRWHQADLGPDVRLIHLRTTDIEGTIEAILSCRRIVTGSLHGLILADAYGIPSAWVMSRSAHGGMFKFFDYFATVNKLRTAQHFDTTLPVTAARLHESLSFDRRPIEFDHRALLDACPYLQRVDRAPGAPLSAATASPG